MHSIRDHLPSSLLPAWLRAGLLALLMLSAAAQAQNDVDRSRLATPADQGAAAVDPMAPRQLRSPLDERTATQERRTRQQPTRPVESDMRRIERPPTLPSEFEIYVNRLANPALDLRREALRPGEVLPIRRLGAELIDEVLQDSDDRGAVDFSPVVPPDYVIAPGDELVLSVWGSVDAELRLIVDRSGRITVPRVGSMMVSGIRYADLPDAIRKRVAQTFRNFDLSVALGQLRGVRVFVTGFVNRPGVYTVSALSTMANALVQAGGPSASGSFRDIQLRRANKTVSQLDLYQLLLAGNRSADLMVQAGDVVHVGPIGTQVAVIGSVNRAAIFELKPGETMADALRMAGGFSAVADTTRLVLERVDDRASVRAVQIEMAQADATKLQSGDVLRAFNAVTLATSQQRQNKRVRVEGEVLRPGDYILPASSTLDDALRAAGGLAPMAFVFGTEFTRESVRVSQQENYERALRNLETEISLASSTQRITTADEAAAVAGRSAATTRLIEKLRLIKPTGRIVLQMPPDSRELPKLVLEDGDRLFVPAVPSSVGVFGSVFNAGSYLREDGRTLSDYLNLAGGPTRGADERSTFVLRANGTVVSNLQKSGWGGGLRSSFETQAALPGDTLFVPEELDKTTFVQHAKDWTQILAQFALGVAAFVTLTE
jgi:protein involved in polysaccharide export with SLBB domain